MAKKVKAKAKAKAKPKAKKNSGVPIEDLKAVAGTPVGEPLKDHVLVNPEVAESLGLSAPAEAAPPPAEAAPADNPPPRLAVNLDELRAKEEAEYNRETIRLINESEKKIRGLLGDWAIAHGEASRLKKLADSAKEEHLELIRKREEERNQPSLFPGWNSRPEPKEKAAAREGLTESPDTNLPPDEWKPGDTGEAKAEGVINPDDSWRKVKVSYLKKFGLTDRIVEKFSENGFDTLGDVSDYVTPKPGSSWIPQLTDKPGLGSKSVERFSDAEFEFFKEWNQGKKTGSGGTPGTSIGAGIDSPGSNGKTGEPPADTSGGTEPAADPKPAGEDPAVIDASFEIVPDKTDAGESEPAKGGGDEK